MTELNIEITTDGFVHDAKYRYPIWELCNEYRDSFPGAEKLIINVHERHLGELINSIKNTSIPIVIASDKTIITITDNVQKYYDTKGKVTSIPDPVDIIRGLRFLLNKAVEEFNKK